MKKICVWYLLGVLGLATGVAQAQSQLQDWTSDPLPTEQIKTVAYRGWVPARTEPLRGTLVLVPGRLSDGRGMAADPKWQELATSVGFAVLACQFADGDGAVYQYDAQNEVAKSIAAAVTHLGQLSGHPELEKAPLAFWGHSAGANIAAKHTNFAPMRVIAMAGSKGSWGSGPENPPGKDEIPMLFILGGKDKPEWITGSLPTIEAGQKRHAPWILALQKNEAHDPAPGLPLVRAFLKASIEQRFTPPKSAGATGAPSIFKTTPRPIGGGTAAKVPGPVKLERIDQHQGWLGDPDTFEIAPAATYKGSKSKAVWLPDEETAKIWQAYLRG